MANFSKLISNINAFNHTVDFSLPANVLEINSMQMDGSTSGHVVISASAITSTYSMIWPSAQAASAGYILTNDGTGQLSWSPASATGVTSVALALPASVFTVSGSPVTSTGTLTGSLNTQSANTVWAGPTSGSAAAPTFRSLVSADIPSLSAIYLPLAGGTMSGSINGGGFEALNFADPASAQSLSTKHYVDTTTISSGLMTTKGDMIYENATPAPARLPIGSTGQILTVAGGLPVWAAPAIVPLTTGVSGILPVANGGTNSNATLSNNRIMMSVGGAIVEGSALTNGQIFIGSTGSAPVAASLTAGSGVTITPSAGGITIAATGSGGTVTSVALSDGSTVPIFSISGSPVTGSGTLTQTLVTQSAHAVFAGPTSGSAAQPSFRALVAADIPSLSATYVTQSEVGTANGVASLDAGGKIPVGQLPNGVFVYQGLYNPSTNSPTLVDGVGVTGQVYYVSTAYNGVVTGAFGGASLNFSVGDLAIYNGTAWELTTPAAGVSSVNGAYGAVILSMVSANGFAGTYSGTALTVSTTVTGILQGNGTAISAASTTGSGAVVLATSPTLVTPNLGTPSALVGTNITGTAAGLTAGTVTTNANLTGDVTSVGNTSALVATTNATITTLSALTTASSLASVGTITSGTWNGTTIAIAHGGTGQVTAPLAFAALSPLTTAGDIIFENATPAPARLPIGSTGNVLTVVAGLPAWAPPATSGTVSSVAFSDGSATPIFSVSGSPVTSSGTLTNTLINQNANLIFAGPSTGSAAQPTFRSIVSADLSAGIIGSTQLATASVTAAKLGSVTDGVTLDQTGSGSTIEIKAAGVSATQLATGAFDQVTITGGAGTAAAVAQAPALKRTLIAGQTFTANTSYAVRWGIVANGETAGRVYAADTTTSSFNLFYVIGMASSAAGVSAGSNISVTTLGAFALSSADTAFASGTDGTPVFLGASGVVSTTPPSASGTAVTRIGMVMIRSATVTSNIIDVHPVPVLVN